MKPCKKSKTPYDSAEQVKVLRDRLSSEYKKMRKLEKNVSELRDDLDSYLEDIDESDALAIKRERDKVVGKISKRHNGALSKKVSWKLVKKLLDKVSVLKERGGEDSAKCVKKLKKMVAQMRQKNKALKEVIKWSKKRIEQVVGDCGLDVAVEESPAVFNGLLLQQTMPLRQTVWTANAGESLTGGQMYNGNTGLPTTFSGHTLSPNYDKQQARNAEMLSYLSSLDDEKPSVRYDRGRPDDLLAGRDVVAEVRERCRDYYKHLNEQLDVAIADLQAWD